MAGPMEVTSIVWGPQGPPGARFYRKGYRPPRVRKSLSPPVRAVLDTNIYISALALPGSSAEEALRLAALKRYELATSPAILAELANVLTRKFDWDAGRAMDACKEIAGIAVVVRPKKRIRLLNDDPDNRILECATAAKADQIVTGDKHLLQLGHYGNVHIVRLGEFLRNTA